MDYGAADRVEPLRLRLKKPLEGPYAQLLTRPLPEVESMRLGQTVSLIRGFKLLHPLPVMGGERSCYYSAAEASGWSAEHFLDSDWAQSFSGQRESQCTLVIVPYGHYRLDNVDAVHALAEELTPWRGPALGAWAAERRRALWLTVFRTYEIAPVAVDMPEGVGLKKIRPFRARKMRPVLSDSAWAARIHSVACTMRHYAGGRSDGKGEASPVSLGTVCEKTGYDQAEVERWQRLLLRKKQLVFSGAPGTGKTYVARHFARWIAAESGGCVETVQFHPATAYEDLIQGLRPRHKSGKIDYHYADGAFLQFCQRARANPHANHVFFIDELNRAPIARVFGELLYLLEYRDESIRLSASGQPFSVPSNALILATMNGADRSIAAVDQALMRRFAFVRLQPNLNILAQRLRAWGLDPEPLVTLLDEINDLIESEDRLLGISFFMQDGEDLPQVLEDVWRSEVEPYLEEALYELPEAVSRFRWDGVERRLAGVGPSR